MKKESNQSDYLKSIAKVSGTLSYRDEKWPYKTREFEYFLVRMPDSEAGFLNKIPNGFRYNGYVLFPQRPVIERGYEGILSYVPVHGGITYAEEDSEGRMMYGFDTAHYDSSNYPIDDKSWIEEQIGIMTKGILIAAKVEKKYLRAFTDRGKVKCISKVLEVNLENYWNLGAALNVLSGKL